VGAGIAAYKACELLRLLTESGHRVRVVPTPDALRFVGEVTWAALSGEPVSVGLWDETHQVQPRLTCWPAPPPAPLGIC
jgi:phosphopantothenoylcysteine decarboxylase/phosphopantothenate--cysteine ligase